MNELVIALLVLAIVSWGIVIYAATKESKKYEKDEHIQRR